MSEHRFGPNGVQVSAFIERLKVLTPEEIAVARRDDAVAYTDAWFTAFDAAWAARRDTLPETREVDWEAVLGAAFGDAYAATMALLVRELISVEHFTVLTAPFKEIIAEFTEASHE